MPPGEAARASGGAFDMFGCGEGGGWGRQGRAVMPIFVFTPLPGELLLSPSQGLREALLATPHCKGLATQLGV